MTEGGRSLSDGARETPTPLEDWLACPACLGPVEVAVHSVRCRSCGAHGMRPSEQFVVFGAAGEPPTSAGAVGVGLGAPPNAGLEGDAWTFFVPVLAGRTVLSIEGSAVGASMGAAGHRAAGLVVAFPDRHSARAAAAAAAAGEHDEVTVVSLPEHPERLPFQTGTFDVVAVHHLDAIVASAVGAWSDERALLREVARVAKTDGVLYVDGRDARLLGRRRAHQTRSIVRVAFDLWQLGRRPLHLLRQWEADGRRYKVDTVAGRRSRLVNLASLPASLFRGRRFALVAGAGSNTRLDHILDGVPGAPSARRASFHFGSGGAYRVEADTVVVRLPCEERGRTGCRNGYETLEHLQTLSLPFATPRPLARGVADDQAFFVETRIPGREIRYLALSRDELRALSAQACRMLTELHAASVRQESLTPTLFAQLFLEPLHGIVSGGLDAEAASRVQEVVAFLRERFLDHPIHLVRTHGDFKITNLVQDAAGRATGLVDWDLSQDPGLPAMDLILYRAFDRHLESGDPLDTAILDTLREDVTRDATVGAYRERFGVTDDRWRAYGLLALVQYVRNQDSDRPASGPRLIERRAALLGACRLLVA